jgi:cell division protein FtsW (lipid II flippase)
MTDLISQGVAILFAVIIFGRAVCVVYSASPKKHSHPLHFIGFGYSYIVLGAGAAFAAVALCSDRDVHDLALWLLLLGSCGLIVFDRRAALCWSRPTCPIEDRRA